MNQVQTQPAPANVHRGGAILRVVVLLVLAAVVLGISLFLVRDQPVVSRVTVDNDTALELDVDIASGPGDGWVPAGVALRRGATTFLDVHDHGDTWAFRFTSGGERAVVRVSRAELADNGWRLTVPVSVGDELTAP